MYDGNYALCHLRLQIEPLQREGMCRCGKYSRWDPSEHSDMGHFVAVTSDVDISIATVEAINPDARYFQLVPKLDGD